MYLKRERIRVMSAATTVGAHIAHEMMNDREPAVVVIDFRAEEITGVLEAHELGDELDALICPEMPHRVVIDFAHVRAIGSAAFGEIVSFARKVGRLVVCNIVGNLRLNAALTDLDLYAAFAPDRESAIEEARSGGLRGQDETADFPTFGDEADDDARRQASAARPLESNASRIARNAKAADERMLAGGEAESERRQSPQRSVALAHGLTVEDFGGRSDAPGG
jgi:anti-anti-sigma regulatory factor